MFDGAVSESPYVVTHEADKCCVLVFRNTAVTACGTMMAKECPATNDSVGCTASAAAATAFKQGGNL